MKQLKQGEVVRMKADGRRCEVLGIARDGAIRLRPLDERVSAGDLSTYDITATLFDIERDDG